MAGLKKYSSVIIALVVGVIIGLVIGTQLMRSDKLANTITGNDQMTALTSATGSIEGEITAITGNKLSVKSLSGQEGIYSIAKDVRVYSLRPGEKQATSSSTLDQTILNQKVLLGLRYQNGNFEVVSVSRIPAQQSGNPTAPATSKR